MSTLPNNSFVPIPATKNSLPNLSDNELKELVLKKELEATDLTLRLTLKKLREALDAKIINKVGGFVEESDVPDHEVRLKAIAMIRDILPEFDKKNVGVKIPMINIIGENIRVETSQGT